MRSSGSLIISVAAVVLAAGAGGGCRSKLETGYEPRRLGASPAERRAYYAPRFTPEAIGNNRPLVDLLREVGARENATPAQIALAWLLARQPFVVPIPGTTKVDHLKENLGAANVALSRDDLTQIDSALSNITVHGARTSPELQRMSDDMSKQEDEALADG